MITGKLTELRSEQTEKDNVEISKFLGRDKREAGETENFFDFAKWSNKHCSCELHMYDAEYRRFCPCDHFWITLHCYPSDWDEYTCHNLNFILKTFGAKKSLLKKFQSLQTETVLACVKFPLTLTVRHGEFNNR